jgi:MarR family transcriptional regulator for hemolysin
VIDGPQMFVAVIKAKSPTRAAQRGGASPDPRELFRVKIVGAWFCEYAATPITELSQATAIPLVVLSRRGKCVRQGVLAEEMGIEGPSLVRLIDLLQTEGLVERREDPTDRRAKMLHLTALGEMRADEINRVLRRVRAHLLKGVSGEDLAVTFEALRRIEQRASRLQEAAAMGEAAQP